MDREGLSSYLRDIAQHFTYLCASSILIIIFPLYLAVPGHSHCPVIRVPFSSDLRASSSEIKDLRSEIPSYPWTSGRRTAMLASEVSRVCSYAGPVASRTFGGTIHSTPAVWCDPDGQVCKKGLHPTPKEQHLCVSSLVWWSFRRNFGIQQMFVQRRVLDVSRISSKMSTAPEPRKKVTGSRSGYNRRACQKNPSSLVPRCPTLAPGCPIGRPQIRATPDYRSARAAGPDLGYELQQRMGVASCDGDDTWIRTDMCGRRRRGKVLPTCIIVTCQLSGSQSGVDSTVWGLASAVAAFLQVDHSKSGVR